MTVRRANSCPEMKKTSSVQPSKDNIGKTLDETDEEGNIETKNGVVTNKRAKQKILKCSETQTENFWPMPYEHLFLGIFPSMENPEVKPSPAPSPAPTSTQQEKYCPTVSVNEILDKYIEKAANSSDRDLVKNQLQLLHQQLLFERHRRETHAYGNRRLLADARNIRAFEEHNSALRDQVQLQQKDIDSLREELDALKKSRLAKDKEVWDRVESWEHQYKLLQGECKNLSEQNSELKKEMDSLKGRCVELEKQWQITESALLDATTEVKIARELALAAEKGKVELEVVHKQLLLAGELNLKYQERLADLQLHKRSDEELNMMKDTFQHELRILKDQLEGKAIALEACRTRIAQLEQTVTQSEDALAVQKRRLNEVREESNAKDEAMKNKYKTQAAVIRVLEEKVVELMAGRPVNSPDTSSCHEVHVPTTDRSSVTTHSPHASPLSASLGSSEGSIGLLQNEAGDSRGSQVVVDQKDTDRPEEREYSIDEPGSSGLQRRSQASKND